MAKGTEAMGLDGGGGKKIGWPAICFTENVHH
jgi:hypothetical protein